jgi:hypothetical protein
MGDQSGLPRDVATARPIALDYGSLAWRSSHQASSNSASDGISEVCAKGR